MLMASGPQFVIGGVLESEQRIVGAGQRPQDLIKLALRRPLLAGLGVLDNEDHHEGQGGHQGLEDGLPPRGEPGRDADEDPRSGPADDQHRSHRPGRVPVYSRQPPADRRALGGWTRSGHGIAARPLVLAQLPGQFHIAPVRLWLFPGGHLLHSRSRFVSTPCATRQLRRLTSSARGLPAGRPGHADRQLIPRRHAGRPCRHSGRPCRHAWNVVRRVAAFAQVSAQERAGECAGAHVRQPGGVRYAAGIESQAGTAVQAHRGQCQEARREQWPREGNRRADREQRTRPLRGVELGEPYLDPRHVIVTSRRPAVAPGCPGPNLCPAVCPGTQPRHQGPLIDEQDTARACSWPLTLAAARVLKARPLRHPAALPGVRPRCGPSSGDMGRNDIGGAHG